MYLAERPERLSSVAEIAAYYNISRNHLVKVVHRLAQLGYIETVKGKGGGVRIAAHAGQLRLGDVIKELEPNMHMVECFDAEHNTCRITDACKLKHCLFEGVEAFIRTMNGYTLDHVVRRGGSPF
jgi:Rrf2 family nitric oxide-sensitive transcriptional repressor